MAFTVTFPSTSPPPPLDTLGEWLTERGEPFAVDGDDSVTLRALPVRFVASPANASLKAQLELTSSTALTRMVDVLFEVSVRAQADVMLAGFGQVNRSSLWMRLSDDQDRIRIAGALGRAREHGQHDEIHKRLWSVIAVQRPGHDDRWDAQHERIVELVEVGTGISLDEAAWHAETPEAGDVIPVPVHGALHILVWRWLSEAYPGIAESEHTLH
ncbi:MAG: hypothetical protein AAGA48_22115 [Myxococcota bacterium]